MKCFENTFNKHNCKTIAESTMRNSRHFHWAMKIQLDAVCALIQTVGDINKDVNCRTWAKSIAKLSVLYLFSK